MLLFYFIIVSFGRIILFSRDEKLEGTKNSVFVFDRKDAHQEKVLLLKIANLEDLIILKSSLIELELSNDIFKSSKHFFISFIISLLYFRSSETTLNFLKPFERKYFIDFL